MDVYVNVRVLVECTATRKAALKNASVAGIVKIQIFRIR